jgi:hypothetical protein
LYISAFVVVFANVSLLCLARSLRCPCLSAVLSE